MSEELKPSFSGIVSDDEKDIWVDIRENDVDTSAVVDAACNAGCDGLITSPDTADNIKFPQSVSVAIEMNTQNSVETVEEKEILCSTELSYLRETVGTDTHAAYMAEINGQPDLEVLIDTLRNEKWLDVVVIDLQDETNIPLEKIISEFQGSNIEIMAVVDDVDEAEVVLGVMEVGVDGVVIKPSGPGQVTNLTKIKDKQEDAVLELDEIEITRIEHSGMGTRACVDCTALLSKQEGMIVGSSSAGGIFVCSETHPLPYMNTRPFRVNAGGIHSYIWAPDNETKYLSEIQAGEKVLCVDTQGNARSVVVGRSKIERRPLLRIHGESDGRDVGAFLQDDWHVRVMGVDGTPVNITDLEPGDKILGYVTAPGRHVGIDIEEKIIEK